MARNRGLVERLNVGEDVIVAEGYLFEFERRGYLQAGGFIPEVVLEHPDVVKSLHEEFVHAGSDVVVAYTYYGHREKLRLIGRENDLERLQIDALKIAKDVATNTGTLLAGDICNTTVYERGNQESIETAKSMFKEMVEWAVQIGVDYIVAETFNELGEALLALEAIKQYGKGVPAVVTLTPFGPDMTLDGIPYGEACRKLQEAGAAVVGLNCGRGPKTFMPLIREIRHAVKGPVAAIPVPYRTTPDQPSYSQLKDPETGKQAFPVDLPAFACSRTQIEEFAKEAKELGIQYIGLCCGNCSHYTRVIAEVYGRRPPASKYSPNMSLHYIYGDHPSLRDYYKEGMKSHHSE